METRRISGREDGLAECHVDHSVWTLVDVVADVALRKPMCIPTSYVSSSPVRYRNSTWFYILTEAGCQTNTSYNKVKYDEEAGGGIRGGTGKEGAEAECGNLVTFLPP